MIIKYLFKNICIRLMQINNNVYSFFGGILISLSTNIFTTVCFMKFNLLDQWQIYLAILFLTIASGASVYLATKMSSFQNYIYEKHITQSAERKKIIEDLTNNTYKTWFWAYVLFIFSTLGGFVLLFFNYLHILSTNI